MKKDLIKIHNKIWKKIILKIKILKIQKMKYKMKIF